MSTSPIDPRIVAFIKRLAGGFYMRHVNDDGIQTFEVVEQARSLLPLLPKEDEPDLILARIIANKIERSRCTSDDDSMPDYTSGFYDGSAIIAAIREGLQTAKAMNGTNEASARSHIGPIL